MRTAGWAGSARAAGRRSVGAPKTARRIREAGAAGPPATGRRRGGVLNITAAVWTAGFYWWRSGNKKRTQNVSEYMLVLALCLILELVLFATTENLVYDRDKFECRGRRLVLSVAGDDNSLR